jgi:hypothetical protein
VIVFSYFSADADLHLAGDPKPGDPAPIQIPQFRTFWNLCIYSEPRRSTTEDDHQELFTNMFRVKRPDNHTDCLKMKVTVVGSVPGERLTDDPPARTASRVGLTPVELLSLSEIYNPHNRAEIRAAKKDRTHPFVNKTADPSSCSSGHLGDPGGGG